MNAFQQQCIKDAAAIVASGDPGGIWTRKACQECARLYLAWVVTDRLDTGRRGMHRDAYESHRSGCENGIGKR